MLEEIYYGPNNNCKNERVNYYKICGVDRDEFCFDKGKQCCESKECYNSLDKLYCCFKNQKAPQHILESFDLSSNQTWFDVLNDVNNRQIPFKNNNALNSTILERFKNRIDVCKGNNLNYSPICI